MPLETLPNVFIM